MDTQRLSGLKQAIETNEQMMANQRSQRPYSNQRSDGKARTHKHAEQAYNQRTDGKARTNKYAEQAYNQRTDGKWRAQNHAAQGYNQRTDGKARTHKNTEQAYKERTTKEPNPKQSKNKYPQEIDPFQNEEPEPEILTREAYDFPIPHYTKINGWDKTNQHLKALGKILTARKNEHDVLVLEGTRLIKEALTAGLKPSIFVFSRVKCFKEVDASQLGNDCECFHIPYNNIKLWSDLSTPTGMMAVFRKDDLATLQAADPLPVTLICDNIRTPDNLGAVLRVAAAAGAGRVVLTRGCCDPWSSKVLRAAAGAHFLIPIVERVDWETMKNNFPAFPQVLVADIQQELSSMDEVERGRLLEQLELETQEQGLEQAAIEEGEREGEQEEVLEGTDEKKDISYLDTQLLSQYREIPLRTLPFSSFKLKAGIDHIVILVGGETEGVSDAAYKFCHEFDGDRLYIPLRNNVNSLNVISATSIIIFKVQEALLQKQLKVKQMI